MLTVAVQLQRAERAGCKEQSALKRLEKSHRKDQGKNCPALGSGAVAAALSLSLSLLLFWRRCARAGFFFGTNVLTTAHEILELGRLIHIRAAVVIVIVMLVHSA
jgi:hypothetical protein